MNTHAKLVAILVAVTWPAKIGAFVLIPIKVKTRYLFCMLMTLCFLVTVPFNISRASDTAMLDELLSKLAPPPSNEALDKIPDIGRRLLALRSYVRAESKIAERWSWTDEEIKAFQGSAGQHALLAEIEAVNTHFKQTNTGYEIYVHGTVRSLDQQIRKWNSNESVGVAAGEIFLAWQEKFGDGTQTGGSIKPKEVRNWLSGFRLSKRANLAAPGLTLHGRAHAIDFQVMKDGRILAGANSREIEPVWLAEGWDVKLKESMEAAGPSFSGPLTNPAEPWHYDYNPQAQTVSSENDAN